MEHSSVNIVTLAQACGVSRTTVSNALRGLGKMTPETRRRILEAAERLGYRPNRLAAGLVTRRSGTLGVVLGTLSGSFLLSLLTELEAAAHAHGYGLLLGCSQGDPTKEQEHVELLLQKAVDGVIVAPVHHRANAEYFNRLLRQGVRLQFLDTRMPEVEADVVGNDQERGGYLVGQHLAGLGRRRVAFTADSSIWRLESSAAHSRVEGCNRALRQTELPPARILGEGVDTQLPDEVFVREAVRRSLAEGGGYDALFASNDQQAAVALQVLQQAGVAVPAEVSLAGYGDFDIGTLVRPALTTVRQPLDAVARETIHLMARRLQDGSGREACQLIRLQPTLVVRESCGGAG